jgi:hypothetical protein
MFTLPRLGSLVVALILLAPGTAVQADENFRGEGEITITGVEPVKEGWEYTFTAEGSGAPLGDFTGSGYFFLGTPSGVILGGDLILVDGGGDQIHAFFEGQSYDNGLFLTQFEILDGTGVYQGSRGGGFMLGDLGEDPVPFAFDGVLQRK